MRARDTLFALLVTASTSVLAQVAGEELLLADLLGRMDVAQKAGELELAEATWTSLPPKEAVAYFKRKMVMTPEQHQELLDLEDRYGARGFTVAGVTNLDTLKRAHASLTEAIERGTTKADFVKQMKDATKLERTKLELVFDTNVLDAYAAGRYAQMTQPEILRDRPYWQYKTVGDHRVRPTHKAMDGKVFPASSPIWNTWYPPNGYRCRCAVVTLSQSDIDREGLAVLDHVPQMLELPKEAKAVPLVPDPGFDGSPKLQVRADAAMDDIEARVSELEMLRAPRPVGGEAPGLVMVPGGDLDRADDTRRMAKVDSLTRLPPKKAETLAKANKFYNIFPGDQLGEVPPGETWVETAFYSQNMDEAEQIVRRLANQGSMSHLLERTQIAGRASYGDYQTGNWPNPEVVWDQQAGQRLKLGAGHVFSRSTDLVLRIVARSPSEIETAANVALQTETSFDRPVRGAWKIADVRVRGQLPDRLDGFTRAVLNRRPMGSGEQAVLAEKPKRGWRKEAVLVNDRMAGILRKDD